MAEKVSQLAAPGCIAMPMECCLTSPVNHRFLGILILALQAAACPGGTDAGLRPQESATGGEQGRGSSPTPAGTPVPGRVQAELYAKTSSPLTLAPSKDSQPGGQVIAATQPHSTVTYALAVSQPGTYALLLRTATPNQNANLLIQVGGMAVESTTSVASTGADDAFSSTIVHNVLLAAGTQDLSIAFDNDGTLIDWIDVLTPSQLPVSSPAKIGWSNMDEGAIASSPSQWTYVAHYLDMLEWGNNNLPQLQAAAAALSPQATVALSTSGLPAFTGATPGNWASGAAAAIGGAISQVETQANVKVAQVDVNQDPIGPLQSLCLATPADSNAQIGSTFATALQGVASAVQTANPNTRMAMFLGSPVSTTWKGMPAFNNGTGIDFAPLQDSNGTPVSLQGQPVSFQFDTFPILAPYFAGSGTAASGYITDNPGEYFQQGGPAYQSKILAYERWLHGIGQDHTLITDRYDCTSTTPAEANMCYYNAILGYLHMYQAAGGRANTYLIFQLHNGPSSTLPETTQYTFANSVMDAIKYIKGPGEALSLATPGGGNANQTLQVQVMPSSTANVQVQLTNQGDVAAMPVLRAQVSGDGSILPTFSVGSSDATDAILHDGGYIFTGLLQPGANVTVAVTLHGGAAATSSSELQLTLEALWNPQDPNGTVRDSFKIASHGG